MHRLMRLVPILVLAACGAASTETPDAGDQTPDAGGPPPCPDGSHAIVGGCDADVTWTETTALPEKRDHHASFTLETPAGRYLYVIAGAPDHANLYETALRSKVGEDGTLGEWESQPSLPIAIAGPGIAVHGRTVLIVGGLASGGSSRKSFVSHVGDDGALSEWAAGPSLPQGAFHLSCAQDGARVWCSGGLLGTDNLTTVSFTTIGEDGQVPAWTEARALPGKRSHHASAVVGGRLYVSGGLTGNPFGTPENHADVIAAVIGEDGSLGEWVEVGTIPTTVATHAMFEHAGRMWFVGGVEENATFTKSVRKAVIAADGTLDGWEMATLLPLGRGHVHQVPRVGGTGWSCGGSRSTGAIAKCWVATFE